MGNNQSTTTQQTKPLTGPKAKIDIKREEAIDTIQQITDISKKLWKKYHLNFLSRDFCQKLAIAQLDQLHDFSLTQLKNIHNQLNKPPQSKQFKAFLAYNPREQEQFIVDQLKVELQSRFHNKHIPMPEEGELAYQGHSPAYFNYDNIHRYLKHKQTGGQQTEQNLLNAIDAELEKRKEALKRFNKNNNVDKEIIFNIKEINKNNSKIEQKLEELPVELVSDKIIDNKKTNNKNKKTNNKKTGNKNNKTGNKNKNKKTGNKKEFIHYNDRFMKTIKQSFPDCTEGKPCKLTKAQLCEKIVQHYMVRVNLIAAIVSVLPKKGKDGYYGGFCYNRYLALWDGKLCLPPNYESLDAMNTKKQMHVLAKYINNFSEKDCNNVKGLWKELNRTELASLRVREGEFNRYYLDYTAKLQRQYQQSILQLLDVLQKLETTPMIDNATLNQLSEKAKDVIDNLYQSCHRSYTYAMFAFVRADLETTPRLLRQEEEDLQVLKKGLNN